jgi:hypothetical protein
MPPAAIEGEIHVALDVDGARVTGVQISSHRPNVAANLLQGATRSEIETLVPSLFAVCRHAQSTAADLACAAASGESVADSQWNRYRTAVAHEMLRESALRVLLGGPRILGESPPPEAIAAARQAMAFDGAAASRELIARACFGMPAAQWLSDISHPEALNDWVRAGATAAARTVRGLQQATATATPHRTAMLPSPPDAPSLRGIDLSLAADPHYALAPTRHGEPAETGALARQWNDPLLQAMAEQSRPFARCMARLRELAEWLTGRLRAGLGVWRGTDGSALAWVESARGLLVHQVKLVQGRATRYRIVSPTDWNFHAQGALSRELSSSPADDTQALHRRATWLAYTLDPCVSCRIEVRGA